jgi:hypothetical protein
MKSSLILGILIVLCLPASGDDGLPNLVGNWTLKEQDYQGIVFGNASETLDYDTPGNVTWIPDSSHPGPIRYLVIKEQRGNVFLGELVSGSIAETLIGIIAYDNKTIYMIHGDNQKEGILVSPSEMNLITLENEAKGMGLASGKFIKTE